MLKRVAVCALACLAISTLVFAQARDVIRERIEKAKENYRSSVTIAQKKLTDDFESVLRDYTRMGNLDGALAIREERDAFLKSIQVALPANDPSILMDGKWTVVFRSNNPLLYGVPVLNRDSYSLGFDQYPPNSRFVRLRRMDTSEAVILDIGGAAMNIFAERGQYAWRGDKRINRQACDLGIVRLSTRASNRTDGPLLEMRPSGEYTGWGFGEWWSGVERQGYVWNGRGINAIVMEISVSNGPLSTTEQPQLLNP